MPPPIDQVHLLAETPMRGDNIVLEQQYLLNMDDLEVGDPDGIFALLTDEAVAAPGGIRP